MARVEDWLKVVLGGVVGFIGGLATEPLKALIRDSIEARRAAIVLAEEIAMLAAQGKSLLAVYEYATAKKALDVGMFQFRYERCPYLTGQQKGLLLRLRGYEHIRNFYDWISRADGKNLRIETAGNIVFAFAALHNAIEGGKLPKPFSKLLSCDALLELAARLKPQER